MSNPGNTVDKGDFSVSVLFPSDYLKCADLKGRNVNVTITGITVDAVPMTGGKKEKKLVLTLAKTRKKFIAGKTNGYCLGLLFSSDLRACVGKQITLCPDVDVFGGADVATIRIAGSPSATPERARAYEQTWRGDRKQGRLVKRVKGALALIEMSGVPPVEAEAVSTVAAEAPAEGAPVEESDLFADDVPPTPNTAPVPNPVAQVAVADLMARIAAIPRDDRSGMHALKKEIDAAVGHGISATQQVQLIGQANKITDSWTAETVSVTPAPAAVSSSVTTEPPATGTIVAPSGVPAPKAAAERKAAVKPTRASQIAMQAKVATGYPVIAALRDEMVAAFKAEDISAVDLTLLFSALVSRCAAPTEFNAVGDILVELKEDKRLPEATRKEMHQELKDARKTPPAQ